MWYLLAIFFVCLSNSSSNFHGNMFCLCRKSPKINMLMREDSLKLFPNNSTRKAPENRRIGNLPSSGVEQAAYIVKSSLALT